MIHLFKASDGSWIFSGTTVPSNMKGAEYVEGVLPEGENWDYEYEYTCINGVATKGSKVTIPDLPEEPAYIEQRKNKTRQKLLKIRAKKVITATGSLERPLIFDNNDRPGILLSSAIKRYADLFGVACGEKNIFLTNNDSAYESAISLIQKGIKVEAIVDNREEIESKLVDVCTFEKNYHSSYKEIELEI